MCTRSDYQKFSRQLFNCYSNSHTQQDFQFCHKVYVAQIDNCSQKKDVGESCRRDSDCYSEICVARPGGRGNVCVANSNKTKRNTGQSCNSNNDCLSNNCVANPTGQGNICVGRPILR